MTGFIVTDLDTAVAAVQRIDELDRLAARKHVEEQFSVGAMVEGNIRVYNELLETTPASTDRPS